MFCLPDQQRESSFGAPTLSPPANRNDHVHAKDHENEMPVFPLSISSQK